LVSYLETIETSVSLPSEVILSDLSKFGETNLCLLHVVLL
jgi:hypothetical protein